MDQIAIEVDNIVIRDGRVQKVEHWACWNGDDHAVITIERVFKDHFQSDIGDPEHGGHRRTGTLGEVTSSLSEKTGAEYRSLFVLKNPTADDIRKAGFPGYRIINE